MARRKAFQTLNDLVEHYKVDSDGKLYEGTRVVIYCDERPSGAL